MGKECFMQFFLRNFWDPDLYLSVSYLYNLLFGSIWIFDRNYFFTCWIRIHKE